MMKLYKKNLKAIILILTIPILILLVLTLSVKNNDIIKLTKISKEIVNINASLKDAISNDTFEYTKACDILQNNLEALSNMHSVLSSMQFKNSESEEMRTLLFYYTDLNINLYKSALDILKNQEVEDFANLYKSLTTNEKNILKTSNDLSDTRLNISFPKSANSFFVYLNNYVNSLYKLNREKDISNSQKSDFLFYTTDVLSNFSKLKEDIHIALIKIREDKRDLSVLLDDINNKRLTFSEIKNKSYSISIPSGAQNCYSFLEDMINSYDVYISSLEDSVKSEIASTKEKNYTKTSFSKNYKSSEELDDLYSDTFYKYSIFISDFEAFKNSISDYKNK